VSVDPEDLARALLDLQTWAQQHAPRPQPPVARLLAEHLGADPSELPIVTRPLEAWDRPNLQLALDAWLEGRDVRVVGLATMHGYRAGLAELVRGGPWASQIELGAVEYVAVPLGEHESVTCVVSGMWLVDGDDGGLVVMLRSADRGDGESLGLEVMARERERAEEVLAELRREMHARNVYRGRVLELASRYFHDDESAPLTVRTLPAIARERIVLPDGVLERVERQAFGMARHAERLRASGRHLRRGMLLYGPPGVGKTLTVMYLASQLHDRTVVLLTGQSFGTVGPSVDLATALQPAMVVLEDADLVALDRELGETNALLFQLLNAMDGLDEDHDVMFVLTSNRAELLEPALAARPGRIDQAVELPLPDAAGRCRLVELYGEGLDLVLEDEDGIIEELEGVSPAFIRELLRRAALLAAEEAAGPLRVTDRHLRAALGELRQGRDALTRTLGDASPPPDE
jgi:hypothetical protein